MKYEDTLKSILLYYSLPEKDYKNVMPERKKGRLSMIIVGIMTAISSVTSLVFSSETIKYINLTIFTLYGSVNIVLSYLINKTYAQGYLNAYRAKVSGYIDSMTGLYNRNYYKFILPTLLSEVKNHLACIYVDANDLHRINNEFGHEEGDKMLTFIASKIMELFGKEYAFRIGGDEFLCFVPDADINLEEKWKLLKKIIEKERYHTSVGFEMAYCPKEEDMSDLIRNAEKKMYDDKRLFYERTGCDRRKNSC